MNILAKFSFCDLTWLSIWFSKHTPIPESCDPLLLGPLKVEIVHSFLPMGRKRKSIEYKHFVKKLDKEISFKRLWAYFVHR